MQFEPNGIVKLTKVGWNADYRDTRYFASLSAQTAYMLALPGITYTDCSYTRATMPYVAVDANIEGLWNFNYLIYQNETHGSKYFYAFIDHLEMKAASTTFVYFTIDVMQTWMFDAKPTECFVEREHPGIQSDDLSKYSLEESLGIGTEYLVTGRKDADIVFPANTVALLISTIELEEKPGTIDNPNIVAASGGTINQLPTACNYYIVDSEMFGSNMEEVMQNIQEAPWYSSGIISVTLIPRFMTENYTLKRVVVAGGPYGSGGGAEIGKIIQSPVGPGERITDIDLFDLIPDNRITAQKKLYTYPYTFIEISLYNGNTLIVKPQYMEQHILTIFRDCMVGGGSPEVRYRLGGYLDLGNGLDFSLKLNDFPLCPIQNSDYLTSLGQMESRYNMQISHNADNFLWSSLGSTLSGAGSTWQLAGRDNGEGFPYMGINFLGKASGILGSAVSNTNAAEMKSLQFGQAHAQTPTLQTCAGGTAFNLVHGDCAVHIRLKQIDMEHWKVLESYFNKYGYKVGRTKTPVINNMSRFNYIQTVGCHVAGDIANDDKEIMESIFNAGITFWHDDNIGNYSGNVGVS